jgi:simple sugar transport system permease protein
VGWVALGRPPHPWPRRLVSHGDGPLAQTDPTTATAPPARHDERLVDISLGKRLLTRPDIGAFVGAIAIFFAFGYFARDVNWIGDLGIWASWSDQAAQYGIIAVPVA